MKDKFYINNTDINTLLSADDQVILATFFQTVGKQIQDYPACITTQNTAMKMSNFS
jgi:hypothetical protein